MLPDPLHPAVVHLPMALAVLLPMFALGCAFAVGRGLLPLRAWAVVVALAGLMTLSSWAALETGEREEDRVERVVAEQYIESHEEAAERFMGVGLGVLLATGAGLMAGRVGALARGASVVLSIGLLAAGVQVGHRGGALVYEHGAGAAYTSSSPIGSAKVRGALMTETAKSHNHD